jgi:hypothetical protein
MRRLTRRLYEAPAGVYAKSSLMVQPGSAANPRLRGSVMWRLLWSDRLSHGPCSRQTPRHSPRLCPAPGGFHARFPGRSR